MVEGCRVLRANIGTGNKKTPVILAFSFFEGTKHLNPSTIETFTLYIPCRAGKYKRFLHEKAKTIASVGQNTTNQCFVSREF